MKIKCPVCDDRFRHYYLWIRHVRDRAEEEDKKIIEKLIKYSAHLSVFNKILSKCDEKMKILK